MAPLPNGLIAIGVVHSAHRDHEHTPVQSSLNRDEVATIEVDPVFADGLDGLSGFEYAWLLTWLDHGRTASPSELRQVLRSCCGAGLGRSESSPREDRAVSTRSG